MMIKTINAANGLNSRRSMKPNSLTRLLWNEGKKVASFGAAKLIRYGDGRWELRGGPPKDQAAAREWYSLFQHEATFPTAPLPLTVEQPGASKTAYSRILIADDDSVVRGSLAAVLESEGYVVDEARNGVEAVTRAIEQLPDLVLLDLNMPNWDGWTAFSQLDRVTPLLPVIVITARPNQYQKAVRLGVDAFMEKPLNIPVLVRAIKRLTSEDATRHVRRITNPAFVTELLGSAHLDDEQPAPPFSGDNR
jgi:CheY-like chemotaxis protein